MARILEIIDKDIDISNLCVKLKLYETSFKSLSQVISSGSQTLIDIQSGDVIKDGLFNDIFTVQQTFIVRYSTHIAEINSYISSKSISVSQLAITALTDLTGKIEAGKKLNYDLLQDLATNEKKLVENKNNILNKLDSMRDVIISYIESSLNRLDLISIGLPTPYSFALFSYKIDGVLTSVGNGLNPINESTVNSYKTQLINSIKSLSLGTHTVQLITKEYAFDRQPAPTSETYSVHTFNITEKYNHKYYSVSGSDGSIAITNPGSITLSSNEAELKNKSDSTLTLNFMKNKIP